MAKKDSERRNQWEAYLLLAGDEAIRSSERFQTAGSYANVIEADDMTDEQWAEAFFNAYQED